MPYDPRSGAPREGFVFIEHPDLPGEVGEVPEQTLDHWHSLGWRPAGMTEAVVEAIADALTPDDVEVHGVLDPSAPADATPAPEGDSNPSEED